MSDFTKAELKFRIQAWMERANHFELDKLYSKLINCKHPVTVQKGDSHYCEECKNYVGDGWWCPDSPDHHCYYFSVGNFVTGRYIELRNGEKFYLHKAHNHNHETDDCCLFCGAPDERK